MIRPARILFAALLLTLPPVLPVWAQQNVYGYNRFDNRTDNRGDSDTEMLETAPRASSGTSSTYMETRISDLETQLRTLNGRLEQAEWANKKLQSQLDRVQGDLEMRLQTVEQNNARPQAAVAPPPQLAPPTATPPRPALATSGRPPADEDAISRLATGGGDETSPAPPVQSVSGKLGNLYMSGNEIKGADQSAIKPSLPKPPADYGLTAQEQYDRAFSLLRGADYAGAETAFKAFIGKYPKAAVTFADAYQSAPKGSKAPDSLFKLGLSLAGLKKTEDACTTLGEVGTRYPNAAASIKSRAEQEMKKLKCKA
jgi:TolA-binding protein